MRLHVAASSASSSGVAGSTTPSPHSAPVPQPSSGRRAQPGTMSVPISVLTDSYKATHFLQYPGAIKMVAVGRRVKCAPVYSLIASPHACHACAALFLVWRVPRRLPEGPRGHPDRVLWHPLHH